MKSTKKDGHSRSRQTRTQQLRSCIILMSGKTTSPPNPSIFFEAVFESFVSAIETTGVIERYIKIAGHTICLRFAGYSLIPKIMPALAHLTVEVESGADLTICLWDSVTTNAPSLDVIVDAQWSLHSRRGVLNILDNKQNLALFWVRNPSLSVFKLAAPCQLIFHWWLRDQGLYLIHSAVVGLDIGAAMVVGNSGSGKSTSALTCAHAGMKYLADDRCVVALDPAPIAYTLYNSGKVEPGQLHHFPRFQHAFTNLDALNTQKALLYTQQTAPDKLVLQLPLKVILSARLTYQTETTISPIKPMEVCQVLASSTMIYTPGWSQEDLRAAVKLVQKVPCYALNLGTDLWQIPDVISRTITQMTIIDQNAQQQQYATFSQ
jgi:hypothetical protein